MRITGVDYFEYFYKLPSAIVDLEYRICEAHNNFFPNKPPSYPSKGGFVKSNLAYQKTCVSRMQNFQRDYLSKYLLYLQEKISRIVFEYKDRRKQSFPPRSNCDDEEEERGGWLDGDSLSISAGQRSGNCSGGRIFAGLHHLAFVLLRIGPSPHPHCFTGYER